LQLTQLAAHDKKLALLATVKETGVDDKGLLDFYRDYFNSYPIYKDEKWQLYKAMGGKTIGYYKLLKAALSSRGRLKTKKIRSSKDNGKSNVAWMCGGVLVFDRAGELVYVMGEKIGDEFEMEQLELAIQEARSRNIMADDDSTQDRVSARRSASSSELSKSAKRSASSSELSKVLKEKFHSYAY